MGLHHRCVWNCGGTSCDAPIRHVETDKKAEAIRRIYRQPFFTAAERVKITVARLNALSVPNVKVSGLPQPE